MVQNIGKTPLTINNADDGVTLMLDGHEIAFFKTGNYSINTYSTQKGAVKGIVITTSSPHIGKYYYFVSENEHGFRKSKTVICDAIGVLKKDYKSFTALLK